MQIYKARLAQSTCTCSADLPIVGQIHTGNSNVRTCTTQEAITLREEDEKRRQIVHQAKRCMGWQQQPTDWLREAVTFWAIPAAFHHRWIQPSGAAGIGG